MQPTTYYSAHARATPAQSAFVVDGIGIVGLGALLAFALLRRAVHLRRFRAAAAALGSGHPRALAPGPVVVTGRVLDEGDGPPVVLEIEQSGREQFTKGRWVHRWTEEKRQLRVRPFYLVRPNGERVRVEPDDHVLLVDRLDETENLGPGWRRRRAALRAGDTVSVQGTLARGFDPSQGGYRDGGEGWVLKPTRGTRMELSTEQLGDRHQKRAATFGRLALILTALILISHVALFGRFHLLRLDGDHVTAAVTDHDAYRAWVRSRINWGHWIEHYRITAAFRDGGGSTHLLVDEVSPCFFADVANGLNEAPFVVSRHLPAFYQVGSEPSEESGKLVMFVLLVLASCLAASAVVSGTRPWYERKRVVEGGSGRL